MFGILLTVVPGAKEPTPALTVTFIPTTRFVVLPTVTVVPDEVAPAADVYVLLTVLVVVVPVMVTRFAVFVIKLPACSVKVPMPKAPPATVTVLGLPIAAAEIVLVAGISKPVVRATVSN